jgi:hypothetical protein
MGHVVGKARQTSARGILCSNIAQLASSFLLF